MSQARVALAHQVEALDAERARLHAVVMGKAPATPLELHRAGTRLQALVGARPEAEAQFHEQMAIDKAEADAEKAALRAELIKRLRPLTPRLQKCADELAAVFAEVRPILAGGEARGVLIQGVIWPDQDLANPDSAIGQRLKALRDIGALK